MFAYILIFSYFNLFTYLKDVWCVFAPYPRNFISILTLKIYLMYCSMYYKSYIVRYV